MTHRIAGTLAAAVVVTALAGGLAGVAQAATTPSVVTYNGTTLSSSTVTGDVGDTFTVTAASGSGNSIYLSNGTGSVSGAGATVCDASNNPQLYCRVSAGGSSTFTLLTTGTITVTTIATSTLVGTVMVTANPTGLGPADVLQQVGRHVDDPCTGVQRPDLDWAGVSPGGWGPSWAQWPNDHTGGFVCGRLLHYSQSLGAWVAN